MELALTICKSFVVMFGATSKMTVMVPPEVERADTRPTQFVWMVPPTQNATRSPTPKSPAANFRAMNAGSVIHDSP